MKDYINDSKVSAVLKLKSQDGFCYCYETVPGYGSGKQRLFKIMKSLYFLIADMELIERIATEVEYGFDQDVIAMYHFLDGESLLQLRNSTSKCSAGESFYYVGNPEFIMTKPFSDRQHLVGFITYADTLDTLLDEFKNCNDININDFYHAVSNIKKPFIMKTTINLSLLIKDLLVYVESDNYYMIKNKALELLYLTFKQYNNISCKPAYKTELMESANHIKVYMDEHYKEKIIISELVKMYNINKTYFYEIFNYLYGLSPYKYLTKLRLLKAYNLLLETDLSIEQISYNCGYNNINKFIKLFKKPYGNTPNKVRIAKLT